jgi:small subunit ribosomal protein S18
MGKRKSGGSSRSSSSSSAASKTRRGFRPRRRKVCFFCANRTVDIDYKDVDLIRKFMSDRGKILPRRRSGTCPKHQRELARQIKKGREIALVPYSND